MEDFQLDLIIGEGPSARSVRIDLPPFTLVGATTRAGLLTTPLRDRFGIQMRLQFYDRAELAVILDQAQRLDMALADDGLPGLPPAVAPRIAGRLLRRCAILRRSMGMRWSPRRWLTRSVVAGGRCFRARCDGPPLSWLPC